MIQENLQKNWFEKEHNADCKIGSFYFRNITIVLW